MAGVGAVSWGLGAGRGFGVSVTRNGWDEGLVVWLRGLGLQMRTSRGLGGGVVLCNGVSCGLGC